ncbi:MAG: cytochrome c family protein [Proteobacteria bacterium]|nr:cytochrome c family protein [Pseudomonadota bacterium]
MNALAWNKIIAALILALLFYKGIEIYAEGAFEVAEPQVKAYVVEGLVAEEVEAVAVAEPAAPVADIMALLAVASPEQGKRIFRRCQACHDASQDGAHKIGPNLFAVMGAPVAQHSDYRYSDALAGHGGTWDFATMDDWLASPAEAVPGNKMSFGGMPKAGDRAALIAYLNSQSDNPLALPVAPPMAAQPEAAEEVIEEVIEEMIEEAIEEAVMEEVEAVGEAAEAVEEAVAVPDEETATEPEPEAEPAPAPAETLEVDTPTDVSEEDVTEDASEEGGAEDEDS